MDGGWEPRDLEELDRPELPPMRARGLGAAIELLLRRFTYRKLLLCCRMAALSLVPVDLTGWATTGAVPCGDGPPAAAAAVAAAASDVKDAAILATASSRRPDSMV